MSTAESGGGYIATTRILYRRRLAHPLSFAGDDICGRVTAISHPFTFQNSVQISNDAKLSNLWSFMQFCSKLHYTLQRHWLVQYEMLQAHATRKVNTTTQVTRNKVKCSWVQIPTTSMFAREQS